jgi:transposase-like protein
VIKAGIYNWVDKNSFKKTSQHYRCKTCQKRFGENTNKLESHNRDINLYNNVIKSYSDENMLVSQISIKYDISITSIRRVLKRYNITKRNRLEEQIRGITGLEYSEYLEHTKNFNDFKRIVNLITRQQEINKLPNYTKRGVCGVIGAYQLDHKYSISEGFKNSVSPIIIGNISNLEFIPWEENNKKRAKCSINLEDIGK